MRVPTEDAPTVEPSGQGLPPVEANPTAQEAGLGVSQALSGIGQTVEEQAKAFQGLQNETNAKEADIKLAQQLDDLQFNPQTGYNSLRGKAAVDAYPAMHQKVMDLYSQARSTLNNPQAQEMFDQVATRRAIYAQGDMSRFAQQQNQEWIKNTGLGRIQQAVNESALYANDPDRFQRNLGTIKDEADQYADLEGISDPAARKVLETHYLGEAWSARIRQVMNVDAKAGKEMIDQAGDQLDAAHRASLMGELQNKEYTQEVRAAAAEARAERAEMRAAAQARVGINHNLKTAGDMIADGKAPPGELLPTPQQILRAYQEDPDGAQAMSDYVDDVRHTGTFIAQLPSMTPDDIRKKTVELAPDPNRPDDYSKSRRLFSIWGKAVEGFRKSLDTDPAAVTATSHPQIQTAWDAAVSDPAGFKPQTFEPYAQATLGAQAAVGVDPSSRSVLPVVTAQRIVSSITENPETAPAKIKQLESQTGSAWPNVWHDLIARGELPPTYQSVAVLDNERDAALLARATNEQSKSGKEWADLLGAPNATAVKNGVRSDPEATKLFQSLAASGSPVDQIDGIMKSVETLAYAKMFYDKMDSTTAIGSAINAFTSKYTFMPQGGARIPVKQADSIQANAEQTLRGLTADKIKLPPLIGEQRMPSGDDYLRTLRASPTWVTSPRADGLRLLDPEGRYVLRPDGTPLTVPFDAAPPPAAERPSVVTAPPPALP